MARLFDDASSQYLERTSAVLTATPITLAAWFYLDDAADPADFTILSLSASTGTEYWTTDVERSGGSAYVRAVAQSGATSDVSTRTTVSMNTWHHGAAVFASSTSRTAYLDGTAGTENTTSIAPSGVDRTDVGTQFYSGARLNYFSGRIAEAAIWSVALTAAEIVSLAKGFSPLLVRPASLAAYWPLVGRNSPETDPRGGNDLTVTGATAADHVRVFNPTRALLNVHTPRRLVIPTYRPAPYRPGAGR